MSKKDKQQQSERQNYQSGGYSGQNRETGREQGGQNLMRSRGSERGMTPGFGRGRQLIPSRGLWDSNLMGSFERPFMNMRRLFDTFFDDMLSPFSTFPSLGRRGDFGMQNLLPEMSFPRVDVTEDDQNVVICAELPGLEEKDVDVSLDEDRLIIRGEKKDEYEDRDRDYYYRERNFGSFERVIPIPENVRSDACQASFRNGVLEVTLPKAEKTSGRRRHIEIGAGRQGQSRLGEESRSEKQSEYQKERETV